MKPLTRADIASMIARNLSVRKSDVSLVVDEIFSVISTELSTGRTLRIRGFGKFFLKPHGPVLAGLGSGETRTYYELPSHMRVAFTPAESLKLAALKHPVPADFEPRR